MLDREEWGLPPACRGAAEDLSRIVKRGKRKEENLQDEIGEFLHVLSSKLCEPEIRQDVKDFVKIIRASKVDEVLKTKIANDRKPELIDVLKEKTGLWESEHNLFIKFKSRKAGW